MDKTKLNEINNQLVLLKDKAKKKKEEKKLYEAQQKYPYEQMAKLSPFFGLVIGKIRSGKSCFVCGFVQYALKHNIYERVMVVSPTIHNQFGLKTV